MRNLKREMIHLLWSGGTIILFIVSTILLGSLSGIQWDLSSNKKFTLSQRTHELLNRVEEQVHIYSFTGGTSYQDQLMVRDIADLLKEYTKLNEYITFEEIDPTKNPEIAQKYNVDQNNMVIFENLNSKESYRLYSLQLFAASDNPGSYQFFGEERFTGAIRNLTTKEKHPIYFISGHGETQAYKLGVLKMSLEAEGYIVNDINLITEGGIPEDAQAIVINGPQSDFNDKETELIRDYLEARNGKMLFMLGHPSNDMAMPNINSIMADYGLRNAKAIAIDKENQFFGNPLVVVPNYRVHTIVNELSNKKRAAVLPLAIAMEYDYRDHLRVLPLLSTSKDGGSYGETDFAVLASGQWAEDDNDLPGPLDLAFSVESNQLDPKAVFVGSTLLLHDDIIREQGNLDFVLNSLAWLREKQDLITIRPTMVENIEQATITAEESKRIFYGTVVVYPLLFLIIGGIVWWRRSKG